MPDAGGIFTQKTSGISQDSGNDAKGWRDFVLTEQPELVPRQSAWSAPILFKAGFDYLASISSRQWSSREAGDYRLIFNDEITFKIVAFNYPVAPRTAANHTALYVLDRWEVSRRFTLDLGVRYARDNGFVPRSNAARQEYYQHCVR